MFKDMDLQEGEVTVNKDKELGLNMVEADDDLQRMIDERYIYVYIHVYVCMYMRCKYV
jgi:hypothetical protein